jgi:hypothetical protein
MVSAEEEEDAPECLVSITLEPLGGDAVVKIARAGLGSDLAQPIADLIVGEWAALTLTRV